MKHFDKTFFAAIMLLLITGCASFGGKSNVKLAQEYLAAAQNFEKTNDLPAAMEQYKLALTADPENAQARQGHDRLAKKLDRLADERFQLGMKYYRKGKYSLARKEFLTALRFRPDHPEASKMLVSRRAAEATNYVFHVIQPGESLSLIAEKYYGDKQKYNIIAQFNKLADATKVKPGQRIMIPDIEGILRPAVKNAAEKGYVEHVIQPGESISMLAKQYYGDYKQFHIIAQYNGLEDATRISVGQTIKIPRVDGLPFNAPAAAQKEPSRDEEVQDKASGEPPSTEEEPPSEEPDQETDAGQEGDKQMLAYRDSGIALFNQGKYEDAIYELVKASEAMPQDAMTREYLSRSYFETGRQMFDQRDYNAARESFETALQYDPKCEQCNDFIKKSEMAPLLALRESGVDQYHKGDYTAAISQLTQFLKQRPDDAEIRTFVSDAYYQKGIRYFNQGEFLKAKEGFESALEYDNNCTKCSQYMTQSLNNYKEVHYNKGIAFFGKEQLPEAIAEWQMVYAVDPKYREVAANLSKAKDLLKKLEKIKRSQEKKP